MSDSASGKNVSLSAEHRLDAVCQRFEDAWKAGTEPRIEDFLVGWEGPERAFLVRELGRLDREYRRSATETPSLTRNPHQSTPAPTPAPDPDEALPRAFGRYTLQRLLGRGGMGRVYLAHDPALDRPVALKLPNPVTAPDWRERFLTEARAAATLTHPNVCPVYEVGEEQGQPYLTMAFIEGETLAAKLDRDGPMEPDDAVALVCTAAHAMQEAHRRGIVHRDLKPSNLMLDAAGRPIIMDFGLALRANTTDDLRLTLTGVALGTPAYMPPEQAGGDHESVGPPSDVYALGVILYELVTGRVPFRAKLFGNLLAKIMRDPPPTPSSLNPQVEPALEAVILKCLAKHPADRFESAGDLAEALNQYLEGDWDELISLHSQPCEIPEHTSDSRRARSSAARRQPPRRGWWLAGAAALVLALFAAGAVIYVQTDYGDLKIELSDPSAPVEVQVNGQAVKLTADGKVTHVKAGPGVVVVSGDGFETRAESFTLKRGTTEEVKVSLVRRPAKAVTGTGKKTGDRDPPVPYPKEPTLIEAPGWQILTDATKDQMQKWLDDRKKDVHSVMWLDAHTVDGKPVFCAIAALDDRESRWKAVLDFKATEFNPGGDIGRLLDLRKATFHSMSAYLDGPTIRSAFLWTPTQQNFYAGPDEPSDNVSGLIQRYLKNGLIVRILRPTAIGQDEPRISLVLEEALDQKSSHIWNAPADKLEEFLTKVRNEKQLLASVTAYLRNGNLEFAAVAQSNPRNWEWTAKTNLTARDLKTKTAAAAATGFRPLSVTGYPFEGAVRYCVVWVKEPPKPVPPPKEPTLIEAPGWQILTDATKDQMQTWLDERKKAKHSVMWLDACTVGDKPVFCAAAALDDRGGNWQAALDIPGFPFPDGVKNRFPDVDELQWTSLCSYVSNKKSYAAALLLQPIRSRSWTVPDMARLDFAQVDAQNKKNGYCYRSLRPYPSVDGTIAFAAIATRKGDPPGIRQFDMGQIDVQEFVTAQQERGNRLTSLVAYPDDGKLLFAAVAEPNPSRSEWSADTGLTAAQLKAKTAERASKGFRPSCVSGCPWDGAVRYCVVWVKEPPKPVPVPKEKTLIEVPGWQILTNATKDEMRKWLDERKKAGHSVMWLDVTETEGKPVFCGAAALDDRQTEWTVFWDLVPREVNNVPAMRKLIDVDTNFLVAGGVYTVGLDAKAVLLFWPGRKHWAINCVATETILAREVEENLKAGGTNRVLRPYPVGESFLWLAYTEFSQSYRSTQSRNLSAAELMAFLEKARRDDQIPLSVVGYAADAALMFAAVSGPNRDKLAWETSIGLTAAQLKAKTDEQAKQGFRPSCVTVYPWDGAVRYCVVWVKEPPKPVPFPKEKKLLEVPGWQILADATKDDMQKWLDQRKKDGHSVTWLDVCEVADKPCYSAVAALDNRAPDWSAFLDVPANGFPAEIRKRVPKAEDTQFASAAGYVEDGKVRLAVLILHEGRVFLVVPDLTRLSLPIFEEKAKAGGHGYRIFRPHPVLRGAIGFAVVTEPMASAGVKGLDLTADKLAKFEADTRSAGHRFSSVSAYVSGDELRFAAVTAENSEKRGWSYETGLTAAQLNEKLNQAAKGFRPESITAYPWDGAVRYCVVWVKEPPKK
jgi:serine/threonine protein kinase